ncbi:Mitotic spindle assembly checkpoint protein MAD1 [Fasciolopsis buskii]|uniref:Mitotic spindle assembly checkpoint protein MAD1 n=1 Tax=Fasciolopsis buskii TaxID=27845 RepID=A0A8E0S142_9TREM|nr:Mitotic spindle assembly checkpoint protein MAD1 [Fasciolopsis buski]
MRGDRLMESFVKASSRFRGAFRELLGYRVDMNPPDEYKVRPVFASDPSEFLMFHVGYTQLYSLVYLLQRANGQLVLKENDFSERLSDDVRAYLTSSASLPGFFAALTLSYLQQATMVT